MAEKVGRLKTIIYIVLAVSISTFLITLPILCAINGIGIWESFHDKRIVFGLVFGFGYGLASGLGVGLGYGLGSRLASGLVYVLVFGFVSGFVSRLVYMLVFGLSVGLIFGQASGLVYALGVGLGVFAGFFFMRKLLPLLKKISEAVNQTIHGITHPGQLKEYPIRIAIASFVIFYVSTILLFSFWYYAIYLQDYSKYFGINDDIGIGCLNAEGNEIKLLHWWHFLYFSVVTIATVGYGDISPVKIIPQILVVAEILSGFGLVAFYLATIFQIISRVGPTGEYSQNRQISRLIKIAKSNKYQGKMISELTKNNEQNQSRLKSAIMRRNWRQR